MRWTSDMDAVEDDDVVDAGAKLDEAFRAAMGHKRSGTRQRETDGEGTTRQDSDPGILAKLAAMDPGKLKALLKLLEG